MKGKTVTKNQKLRELFDIAAKNAAKMFLESDDHVVLPMWHAVQGNGEHILIATPWDGDDEKDMTVAMLRSVFRQKHVKRFAFIVEAWTAKVTPPERITTAEQGYLEYDGPRPSEHPDRREVLMITAEDRSGESIMGMYYILRPEHGPPTLSPLEVMPFNSTAGRMMGLLT
jgi:hypothetical protein